MSILKSLVRAVRQVLIASRLDGPLASMGWPLPRVLMPHSDEYPKPTMRRAVRRGIAFDLDVSDYVQWLTFSGAENSQREILLGLTGPGQTVFDVGTNIGDTLLGLAARVGAEGRATGFEANPGTLRKAQANLALNHFPWAKVEGTGLGESAGEMSFGTAAGGNSGADRFMPGGEGAITVPIITIDDYVAREGLERLDFVKIDVEGFEMKVLRGANDTIERFKPVLFIELCHRNLAEQGDSATGLVQWLEERGYAISEALTGVELTSADPLDHLFADPFEDLFADIICRPAR